MLSYTIAKPYLKNQDMTVYEFMPFDSDPTPEEMKQKEQERLEKEMEAAKKKHDQVIKKYKQRNGRI